MKINNKLLSIPPFISTCWSNVSAIHMKGTSLVVGLLDGDSIEIPGLEQTTIATIFHTHAAVLEEDHFSAAGPIPFTNKMPPLFSPASMQINPELVPENPFKLTFASIDELGSVLQHNPQQAQAPDLPHEILQKIAAITQIISPEDTQLLPKAEPHCNCIHCQIARTVNQGADNHEYAKIPSHHEEDVKEEELRFQQWDIAQQGNNMFTVTNRLETKEKYNVFLGSPMGCTCGSQGCEHIVAVLKS